MPSWSVSKRKRKRKLKRRQRNKYDILNNTLRDTRSYTNYGFELIISTFSTFWQKIVDCHSSSGMNEGKVSNPNLTENTTNSLNKGQVNWAYRHETTDSDSDMGCQGDDSHTQESHYGDEEKGRTCGLDTHSIILDISTTSFVDTVTVKTLKNVCVCQDLSMLTFI